MNFCVKKVHCGTYILHDAVLYFASTRPTQPFILTGSINRVPTCPVVVKAGQSPLSGGR